MDCLFCKILNKEIPSSMVYEDDYIYAFKDISPMAKEHYLFISKNHSNNVTEMDSEEIQKIYAAISDFTKNSQLLENGFRVVTNVNAHGGQTVFHTHFHVLGGEQLRGFGA